MRLSVVGLFPIALYAITFAIAKSNPEGVVCRSFVSAKKNGALDSCKKLWRNAVVTNIGSISSDCKRCQRYLSNRMHRSYAKSLRGISTTDIKTLSSDLKNDVLTCALLKKCSGDTFFLPTLKFSESSTCVDCKRIIDDIRALIQDNATEATIATYLKSAICVHLPLQVVDICKRTVDSYIKVLVDLIASELDSDSTCASIGLCPGLEGFTGFSTFDEATPAYSWINRPAPKGYEFFHSKLVTPKSNDTVCNECVNVFSRIRNETKDPEFDKMVKNAVKSKLCESFGYFKAMCEAAVSKEVDAMIDGAAQLNISQLCVFFKQCQGDLPPRLREIMKDTKKRMALAPDKPKVEIPGVCEFCEVIMNRVIHMTVGNRTEEAIRYALEEVCTLLPSKESDKCREFVDQYADVIIRAIVEGTAPKVICMAIGACYPLDNPAPPTKPLEMSCKLCEVIIDSIYQQLETNASKEEIIRDLETVCKYIPYFKNECKNLVDTYAAQVIDLIIAGAPSEEVCQTLGFCPKPQKGRVGDGCEICQVIFIELYSKLRDNLTVDAIEQYLESVCSIIPSSYADKCREIIKQDTAFIIDLVIQQLPPKKICQELGICYERPALPPRDAKCPICKEIINYIYSELEDDTTAEEIEGILENVCNYIPKSLQAECQEYVKAYTPLLIDLLVNKVPAEQVCQTLGFCPSQNLVKTFCAGGPVAWCADRRSAAMCSKNDFCRAFVWEGEASKPQPRRRPSVVKRYDCSKLTSREERCSDERLMRLCGFQVFCTDFKRPMIDVNNPCRFCKNLVSQRLIMGASTLDCLIYVNPAEKAKCEKIRSLKIPGRLGLERVDKLCMENNLCDSVIKKPAVPSRPSISQVLGDDPCLWGPSVTCRDADIAARCESTPYCQQHVWKSSSPPPSSHQASRVIPGIELVNCALPPAELCVSPSLRFCGESVLESCRKYGEEGEMLRHEMCKDRSVSLCGDEKMVQLCGIGEYCEAMGRAPIPAAPVKKDEKPLDPRCSHGPAFFCQNHDNAVLCGQVELCKKSFWPA